VLSPAFLDTAAGALKMTTPFLGFLADAAGLEM
jgi:hypothetical protein